MKAHPPVTAEPSSHTRPEQARPSRFVLTMRRVAIGAAGLAVAVLAAAACVLSFDDLRALAMQAGARAHFAYLYPAAFDALLVTALISFMLLSTARPLVRLQAGFVLFVLLAAASWANVSMAMRFTIDVRVGAVIVGVVPWVMLLIGLWLLTLLIKHAQVRRTAYERGDGAESRDIVPFDAADDADADTAQRPRPDLARAGSAPVAFEPLASPTRAPTTPIPTTSGERLAVDHEPPVPEPAIRPNVVTTSAPASTPPIAASPREPMPADASATPSAPALEESAESDAGRVDPASPAAAGEGGHGQGERSPASRDVHGEPPRAGTALETESAEPVRPVKPAEPGEPRSAVGFGDTTATSADTAPSSRSGHDDVEGDAVTPPVQGRGRPNRPIQWGDLLRPPQGDVLVHPRPGTDPRERQGLGRAAGPGRASASAEEEREAEATDWEPEETESGPQETDASSDEADAVTVETAVPVWPPDAIDTRPNVAMPAAASQPDAPDAADRDATSGEESEAERDTQPYPHLRDRSEPLENPDPAHRAGEADPEESASSRVPAAGGPTVPLAPPSGRMRSTPVPPQE